MSTPAEIISVLGRTGTKGITRARCRLISDKEQGKILTRNIIGPVKVGDIVMLKETEMESSSSYGRR